MSRLGIVIVTLVLAGLAGAAEAWGPLGHEIICDIALQEVDDATRDEVQRLISPDPEFSDFAAACNWPDQPKRRQVQHWVNLPRSSTRIRSATCPLAAKCIFTGIQRSQRLLSRRSAADRLRLEELKFFGHWIGDLHQPLHVSFKDDRGGNEVTADGVCSGNLHRVWDSCIVHRRLGSRGGAPEIARRLRHKYAAELAAWRAGGPVSWADESLRLAIDPDLGYCVVRRGACWYSESRRSFRESAGQRTVIVDDAYLDRHAETVERRLTQAGIRLAAELDRLLATSPRDLAEQHP